MLEETPNTIFLAEFHIFPIPHENSGAFTGTGTLEGQTLATTNQIPSLTNCLQQAIFLDPICYSKGRKLVLASSAVNKYLHLFPECGTAVLRS